MKSGNLLLALGLLLLAGTLSAQTSTSGIYLTAADFQQKRLQNTINADATNIIDGIRLNGASAFITVIRNGEKTRIAKDGIYGVRLRTGQTYRLVDRVAYEVLNPDDDLLLYRWETVSSAKNPIPPRYFFSAGADGQLSDLTTANLKKAYPDRHAFHDALDQYFTSGRSLLQFDDFHRQFKLVRLFVQSSGQVMTY